MESLSRFRFSVEGIFVVGRLDGAVPWTVEFLEQLFGGRLARFDDAIERLEMPRLIAAIMVDAGTAAQPRMRERQAFPGDFEQIAVPDPGLEAEMRNVVAQPLALMGGPGLRNLPGRIEAHIVIQKAHPEGRQSRQPVPWPAVGAAHFEIALQPHLREDR